jgi:hypothetical protein
MAQRTITDDDEGKRVVNADGDTIGIVSTVRNETAYVDPDPGITDKIMARFGWDDVDEDHYPLERSTIDTITDDEIRLK